MVYSAEIRIAEIRIAEIRIAEIRTIEILINDPFTVPWPRRTLWRCPA